MSGPHLPVTWTPAAGDAVVGGCSVAALVTAHGTPLQVLDAVDLDARATEYVAALDAIDRPARAVFATKSLPLVAVIARFARLGIGVDVTTDGELATALAAGVDPVRIVHHGNGRGRLELQHAAESGVGLVVIDGPQDVEHLDAVATRPVEVLVRLAPGVPPATHPSMATAHHGARSPTWPRSMCSTRAAASVCRSPRRPLRPWRPSTCMRSTTRWTPPGSGPTPS